MRDAPVVLCFGDSNTHGTPPMTSVYDLDRFHRDQRWPGIVQNLLGDSAQIIEEGHPGRTTLHDNPTGGGKRNGLEALQICLETHRPIDCVVLMLGTNDLQTQFCLNPWVVSVNLGLLIEKIHQMPCGPVLGIKPKVLVIAPPNVLEQGFAAQALVGAAEKSTELPIHYRGLAEQVGVEFFDANDVVSVDPLDGVHLNAEGHLELGKAIAQKLQDILELDAQK